MLTSIYDDRVQLVAPAAPILRVVLQEIGVHEELRAAVGASFREQVAPEFGRAIRRLQRAGLIRDDVSHQQATRMIITSIAGDLFLRYIVAIEDSYDAEAERAATLAMLESALAG